MCWILTVNLHNCSSFLVLMTKMSFEGICPKNYIYQNRKDIFSLIAMNEILKLCTNPSDQNIEISQHLESQATWSPRFLKMMAMKLNLNFQRVWGRSKPKNLLLERCGSFMEHTVALCTVTCKSMQYSINIFVLWMWSLLCVVIRLKVLKTEVSNLEAF